MRIYHAEMTSEIVNAYRQRRPEIMLNILLSYARVNRDGENFTETLRDYINSVILDSGAWTANNSEEPEIPITIDNYVKYLKMNKDYFDFYFNLDLDFGLDGFDQNLVYQRILEKEGLNPVPVVHDIYSKEVDCYIDEGHPIIALGSSQTRSLEDAELIITRLYNKRIKVHLFGFSQFDHLYQFPVFSCDSSNWLQVARRDDEILYWNPKSDEFDKTERIAPGTVHSKKKLIYFNEYDYQKDLEDYLWAELKMKHDDLLGGALGRFNRSLVNVHYYSLLEQRINEHHRELGFSSEILSL